MPTINIEVTDAEYKCLEYAALSPQEWSDIAVKNRARVAKDEIITALLTHCNANGIAIATGEDAQITQAFDLEVAKTVAVRNAEAEAEAAALAGGGDE